MFSKHLSELNAQILHAEGRINVHDARIASSLKDINHRAQVQVDRVRSHAGSILSIGGVVATLGMFFFRGRSAKRRRGLPSTRVDSLRSLVMPILAPIIGREAAVLLGALSSSPAARAAAPLQTVSKLDLARYAGQWFEVARVRNRYERACASDITATYELVGSELIVINRCTTKSGRIDEVRGRARVPDPSQPGKLKVNFSPAWLARASIGWSSYWVIALSADYSTALVGTPDRRCLWILSRSPQISPTTHDRLVALAAAEGFDTTRLIRTPHHAE